MDCYVSRQIACEAERLGRIEEEEQWVEHIFETELEDIVTHLMSLYGYVASVVADDEAVQDEIAKTVVYGESFDNWIIRSLIRKRAESDAHAYLTKAVFDYIRKGGGYYPSADNIDLSDFE